MKGTGVKLIAVPDLPDFISILIPTLPEIDLSFLIDDVATAKGETWQVENPLPGGTAFQYRGSWEQCAVSHCYFIAGIQALKQGRKPEDLILQSFDTASPGNTGCMVYAEGQLGSLECFGSCGATGKKL